MATLTYGALCRGLLSGAIDADTKFEGDDLRKTDPKFLPPRFAQYLEAVTLLDRFARERTRAFWREWAGRCRYQGRWRDAVIRSLLTLKVLTHEPTGGIVAAPTTSLPEELQGVRNWDYRFCWLRDSTLTLDALLRAGYLDEAKAWRDWLMRAAAGSPSQIQIMYGVAGEHRLTEIELPWLPGYEESRPVRIGNGAYDQFQLDGYGEVINAFYDARIKGLPPYPGAADLLVTLVDFVEANWQRPDEGIWEICGERELHFTHSKLLAWVAVDRAIRIFKEFGVGAGQKIEKRIPRWTATPWPAGSKTPRRCSIV